MTLFCLVLRVEVQKGPHELEVHGSKPPRRTTGWRQKEPPVGASQLDLRAEGQGHHPRVHRGLRGRLLGHRNLILLP